MTTRKDDDLGREAGPATTLPKICPHKPGTEEWVAWVAAEIAATVEREHVDEDEDDLDLDWHSDWWGR
jgi:hypothetical protein